VVTKSFVRIALVAVIPLALVACAPSTTPPPTLLSITTVQVICGGAVPPPGTPACRSNMASRAIQISEKSSVVASGISSADGSLVLEVPAGQLVVSVPGALPYMNCDSPTVIAVIDQTTPVTQTCTILAP
jgi:hypothetical protein